MRTYAVASGKGGVGKTSLAANLGAAMAQRGRRVLLFDADLSLANLDVVLGVKPKHTLQHVLAGTNALEEAVTPVFGGLDMIAGGSAVSALMRSGKKRIGRFLTQLAELESRYDALIFDTSAGVDSKVLTFCRIADEILLVTCPDPTAALDAYALTKVVTRNRPDARIRLIVNMVEGENEAKAVHEKLRDVARRFLDRELDYAGFVRDDPGAAECIRRRSPFVYAHPKLAASKDVVEIAKSLIQSAAQGGTSRFVELTGEFAELPLAA